MRLPPQHTGPDIMPAPENPETKTTSASQSPAKSIVLVGLMGAGKTCIGKRLAKKIGMPFVDADVEIEAAADCSIEEIFTRYGEQAFRDGERRVIARLLDDAPSVIATGGGAFVSAETRENVRRSGISVWLKADVEVLLQRVSRRNNRPLLKDGDKRATLERLVAERYPTYEEADFMVESGNESPDVTVKKVLDALGSRNSEESSEHLHTDTAAE
jgi:shikimate kinase